MRSDPSLLPIWLVNLGSFLSPSVSFWYGIAVSNLYASVLFMCLVRDSFLIDSTCSEFSDLSVELFSLRLRKRGQVWCMPFKSIRLKAWGVSKVKIRLNKEDRAVGGKRKLVASQIPRLNEWVWRTISKVNMDFWVLQMGDLSRGIQIRDSSPLVQPLSSPTKWSDLAPFPHQLSMGVDYRRFQRTPEDKSFIHWQVKTCD